MDVRYRYVSRHQNYHQSLDVGICAQKFDTCGHGLNCWIYDRFYNNMEYNIHMQLTMNVRLWKRCSYMSHRCEWLGRPALSRLPRHLTSNEGGCIHWYYGHFCTCNTNTLCVYPLNFCYPIDWTNQRHFKVLWGTLGYSRLFQSNLGSWRFFHVLETSRTL